MRRSRQVRKRSPTHSVGAASWSPAKDSTVPLESFIMDAVQLATFQAVIDEGSFEAAARALHVTPSAVSQRIKALEQAVGQVLVSRGTPCRPTGHGERLVQLGRQTRLLYDEASQSLGT